MTDIQFSLDLKIKEKVKEIEKLRERRGFYSALMDAKNKGLNPVIAEVKRMSPTTGAIRECDVVDAAREMESGGAFAISILTDKSFGGTIEDLRRVKSTVGIPILRKDFILDEYQIYESYIGGADCILLIASILKERTKAFVDRTESLGMETIVEIHSKEELPYVIDSDAKIVGINNRDLRTMKVSLDTTEEIAGEIPDDRIKVSESGICTKKDVRRLLNAGVDAFLIGTGIMKSDNIRKKVKEFVEDD